MISFSRFIALGSFIAGTASFAVAAPSAGYVDFGSFAPSEGHQYVEVDLDGSLLKLAAAFANQQDDELGKLVANLERVRVNVLGLSEETRDATLARVKQIRAQLDQQGWKRVVTVKGNGKEDVAIFLKQGADDAVHGVVVTVVEDNKEAVLINVVGNVKLEQIASIGERLDLEPLRKLQLAKH